MDISRLYKLNTHEDQLYLHKILGFSVLFNYIYRFGLVFYKGDMDLSTPFGLFTIFMTAILSISSFMFDISKYRHGKMPIIYPEFRMHNTIFVFRSVICCTLFYFGLNKIYNMFVCILTMVLADVATSYYKDFKTSTMRKMPYGANVIDSDKKLITKMNSFMQLVATYYMLENINTAFFPMFAIQISSFLMTLVKKGIISSNGWHYYYTLALWSNLFIIKTTTPKFFILMNIGCDFMNEWRIIRGYDKYIGWIMVFSATYYVEKYMEVFFDSFIIYNDFVKQFHALAIFFVLCNLINKYGYLYKYVQ
jgi:hypothetical protein